MSSNPAQDAIDEKLQAMAVGDSFFLPDRRPEELSAIRKAGYRLDIKLSIRYVERDEIDQVPGTRIWRTA